ncbi:MAG: DUF4405 domain-containing protein [Nitrospirales bacterium]|nr:DUF4405 domain-containing protein [Nitrospirales bacterium]
MDSKKFHMRGFTSLLAGFSLIVMALSGVILYFGPHGGAASWIGWTFMGLGMKSWADMHIISGLAFGLVAAYHLYLNWSSLMSYIYNKAHQAMRMKKELASASAVAVIIIAGSIAAVPPFENIIEFGEHLRKSWIAKGDEPPFPRAERLSLRELCKNRGIDLTMAKNELAKNGLDLTSADNVPIGRIAKMSGISPVEIYRQIRSLEPYRTERTGGKGNPAEEGK